MSIITTLNTLLRQTLIFPVRLYQRFISPLFPPSCRYAPTCSNYAIEALMTHGIIKGTILATWRILRCNPWSHGGVDYVPPKGRWKPDPWIPPEDWVGYSESEGIPMGLPEEFLETDSEESLTMRATDAAQPTDHPAAAGQAPKTSSSTDVRSHE